MNKIRLLAAFPLIYFMYVVIIPIASASTSDEAFISYLQEDSGAYLARVFTLLGLLLFSIQTPRIYYIGLRWVLKFFGFREVEADEEEEEV